MNTGRDCANTSTVLQGSWQTMADCRVPAPACPSDPIQLPLSSWSGVTPDYRALQSIRAAVTAGDAGATDPWPYPAPCHPAVGWLPGLTCDPATGRIAVLRAFEVYWCSGCTWSGYPWWPAPEIGGLVGLKVLDLSNFQMMGEFVVLCCGWGCANGRVEKKHEQ